MTPALTPLVPAAAAPAMAFAGDGGDPSGGSFDLVMEQVALEDAVVDAAIPDTPVTAVAVAPVPPVALEVADGEAPIPDGQIGDGGACRAADSSGMLAPAASAGGQADAVDTAGGAHPASPQEPDRVPDAARPDQGDTAQDGFDVPPTKVTVAGQVLGGSGQNDAGVGPVVRPPTCQPAEPVAGTGWPRQPGTSDGSDPLPDVPFAEGQDQPGADTDSAGTERPALPRAASLPAPQQDGAVALRPDSLPAIAAQIAQPEPIGRDPAAPVPQDTVRSEPEPVTFADLPTLIVRSAADGSGGRLELVLSPAELGPLRIDFAPTDEGLRVTIHAERPEAVELLRRHAGDLLADLRQAGWGQATLAFGTWGEGRPGQGHAAPRRDAEPDAPRMAVAPLSPLPKAVLTGGLHLRL